MLHTGELGWGTIPFSLPNFNFHKSRQSNSVLGFVELKNLKVSKSPLFCSSLLEALLKSNTYDETLILQCVLCSKPLHDSDPWTKKTNGPRQTQEKKKKSNSLGCTFGRAATWAALCQAFRSNNRQTFYMYTLGLPTSTILSSKGHIL